MIPGTISTNALSTYTTGIPAARVLYSTDQNMQL